MIIRNPYTFISKHYKIINLLLLLPMVYLMFKFSDISGFFKDYVKAGYSTPETNFADQYVTFLTFLVPFIMAVIHGFLYFIFMSKKKNMPYHLISAGYNAVLILMALLFISTMESIQYSGIDATFANFVRDCSVLSVFPIYFLMVIGATKGLGFNVRTLRFDNNADLQIREDDDENIELRIGREDNSVKKNLVHIIRELKYYILENKFVFTCITVVLGLIIGVSLFLNFQVYNKTYSMNQAFSMDRFTLSLKDSYITDVDYKGNIISEDKYYLAVKIGIENSGAPTKIEDSNFRIFVGDDEIYPSFDRASRFIDIGKIYQGQEVPHTDENTPGSEYVFVYELTEDQVKGTYQMRILNGLTQKEGKLIKRYKKVNIRPTNIVKQQNMGKVSKDKEISFKTSILGETSYKLNDIEIREDYRYTSSCISNNCSNHDKLILPKNRGNILVIIDDNIKWDTSTAYYQNSNLDFYGDFAFLRYQYNIVSGMKEGDNNFNVTAMANVTPDDLEGKKVYEVSRTIKSATKIDMIIRVRNKIYTIEVK